MRPTLSLLLVWGLIATARALDLTPLPVPSDDKNSKEQLVSFRDPDRRVTFLPPTGWTFSGQPTRFQFSPKGSAVTQAVIDLVPLKEPKELDQETIDAFKQQVLAAVPPGAADVKVGEEAENALIPDGNPSYQVTLSYKAMGKEFRRCAMLVNCPRERLLVRFTAEKSDYLSLLPVFNRSLMSWHVTELIPAAAGQPASPAPTSQ